MGFFHRDHPPKTANTVLGPPPDHHQRNGSAHLLHVGLLDLKKHQVVQGQNLGSFVFDTIPSGNLTVAKENHVIYLK